MILHGQRLSSKNQTKEVAGLRTVRNSEKHDQSGRFPRKYAGGAGVSRHGSAMAGGAAAWIQSARLRVKKFIPPPVRMTNPG